MDAWDAFLPKSGSLIAPPSIPTATLGLDSTIEGNGLPAGTLQGAINSPIGVSNITQGGGYIALDGVNKRLIVSDGTNIVLLAGYDPGAF